MKDECRVSRFVDRNSTRGSNDQLDWLDMFVLGDEPGRVSVRGKTGSKTVTRKDAVKMLELAARATDKQEIHLLLAQAHFLMRCALRNEKRGFESRGRPKRRK